LHGRSPGEDRIVAALRYCRAYWSHHAVGASAILLAVSGLPFVHASYGWWAVSGVVLGVVGAVGQVAQRPSYATLLEERDLARAAADQRSELLEEALVVLMRRLSRDLDTDRRDTRVSVYCHRADVFVLLARIAHSQAWQRRGRPSYPDDHGVIGEAWDIGAAHIVDLPEDRAERIDELVDVGFDRSEAEALLMPSRSLVGVRLSQNGLHVGVLVVESVKARGVNGTTRDALTASPMLPSLCSLLYASRDHFPGMLVEP
jgi:hypothetical protein